MQLLGLLTGMIQAYIFAVLAMVYIASATSATTHAAGRSTTQCPARPTGPDKLKENNMESISLIGMVSIITAGLTIAIGSIGPALGEGRAVAQALSAIAQQPDEAATITRTLFVGLAMIESTAIYCFVVAMILIFANPVLGPGRGAAGEAEPCRSTGSRSRRRSSTSWSWSGCCKRFLYQPSSGPWSGASSASPTA
jgi:F-type H+-transporting ATPase subunit c